MTEPQTHTDRPLLALLLRLLGIAGLAVMAVQIKLAAEIGVHVAEIIFWRQFISIPILLVWAMLAGGVKLLGTRRPKAHGMRALYGFVGMICNFGGVIMLPLAEATTLTFAAPIFAVILSVVIMRETVGWWRWGSVLAGFAGIVVIAQPGGGHIPLFGAVVALCGAFMIALISIQIRDLGRTEKPMVIVFWFAVVSSLVSLPVQFFVFQPHSTNEWLLLLGIGLSGTFGQVFITLALRYGQVSSVIVMDYSNIIWATLLGWLVFSTLPPTTTWLGAPLVVLAGIIIAWRERVVSRKPFVDQRQATGT
ncbi:MAG: DMT family transporter [Erythrobacter sp.]|nr:MAG: DMT family transporter [Erythrobacter sp.]